jgi:hypothetical protein
MCYNNAQCISETFQPDHLGYLVSAIMLRDNIMGQDRGICENYGKQPSLNDLVYNVLEAEVQALRHSLGGAKVASLFSQLATTRCAVNNICLYLPKCSSNPNTTP